MWWDRRDEDYRSRARYFGAHALAGSRWQNGGMELDDETPEDYDRSVRYECPCSTMKLVTNERGGWLVCQECDREIQVITRAKELAAHA
jgi:hypothetical protein